MLVDSHCHLNFPEFRDNIKEVVQNARENGVKLLLTVNTKLVEAKDLQEISGKYDNVFHSVGVHPHEADDYFHLDLVKTLGELLENPKAVGIGETGLDYYYEHSNRQNQIESFNRHLEASCTYDCPVIIHTRDADEDTISCIDSFQNKSVRGVFHCFSGSIELAKQALDRGFYLSFSGIITFKKSDELREVVRFAPMDRILVETDSPFLAPVPYRGKPNQPAYTKINAEKIAEIKGVDFEKVCEATTNNFFDLFTKCKRASVL